MTAVSRGYLTLPKRSIEIGDWTAGIVGDSPELIQPGSLRDWNYYQSVRVRTFLRGDFSAARNALDLTPSDALSATLLWSSSGTSLRGRSPIVPVGGTADIALELTLEPGDLRQQLQVEVVVALTEPGRSGSALAPKVAGSVVWASERYAIDLEGLGSRLPVVAFPFSKRLTSSRHAQWWMHVQSVELEQPVESVLWMWLNDEHPNVSLMLREPEDERSMRTALHLTNDFHRQLLQLAIANEDLIDGESYGRGTLGEALLSLTHLVSADLDSLRAAYDSDPWTVETQLQAAIGFHLE